jgi:hypothetical protein
LNYGKLIEAHRAFYIGENRAKNYDKYMTEQKDWKAWLTPSISVTEAEKLFHFVRSWDRFFRGDSGIFQRIYQEIYPLIRDLGNERIESVNLNDAELKPRISDAFDRVADCTAIQRYESTDASKVLHTILPDFFVMWDDQIKNWTVNGGNDGRTYADEFLPKMQQDLNEAIESCVMEMKLDRVRAVDYIREQCGHETLAKLADEYNYVKYTLKDPSLGGMETLNVIKYRAPVIHLRETIIAQKQIEFAKFVDELKKKGVKGEEYRDKVKHWQQEYREETQTP